MKASYSQKEKVKMTVEKDLSKSVIFPVGSKITNDFFIGDAYLDMIIPEPTASTGATGNVTFAPGARNNWHVHEIGQTLLVTGGEGWYQEEGKVAEKLVAGDIKVIPAGVNHWHGATSNSWFVHIAIAPGSTTWNGPVDDEQYAEAEAGKIVMENK